MATDVVVASPAGEGIRVLARVDGNLDDATLAALQPYEGDEPYFPDYADLSFAHNQEYSEEIVDRTLGHALADSDGDILYRFEGDKNGKSSLERAEMARNSMRRVVTVEFDGKDEAEAEADSTPDQSPVEPSAPSPAHQE